MENKQRETSFEYTYSAPTERERKEIERIRSQYRPLQQGEREEKLQQVQTLHTKIVNTATVWALVLGVVGLLVFGLGMTMCLEWGKNSLPVLVGGCFVGVFACIPMAVAYPVYKEILRRGKKKYGEEILSLCDELLDEDEQKKKN